MAETKNSGGAPGKGVDFRGGPVVDPTENVKDLSEAANKRQDDLRGLSDKLTDEKIRRLEESAKYLREISDIRAAHQETIGKLREEYQEKIAKAESGRLDSIRQVDREEVAKTAVAANTAIATLAKQTTDLATTLQKTVADTAIAAEARNSTQYTETNKRLSALELSSSEGKGKQGVVDPQMDKLTALVETMARNQNIGSGKSEGIDKTWAAVAVVVGLAISAAMYFSNRSTTAPLQPQVIYMPSPAVAPATPPVTLPSQGR
jgi:hypothetical protein